VHWFPAKLSLLLIVSLAGTSVAGAAGPTGDQDRVAGLLDQMTLAEKIGQMAQVNGAGGTIPGDLRDAVRAGRIGSILNEVDVETVNELQRIAVEESRLGIPLLMGRDVIHGFKTVLPIPLGQAATFNPDLVRKGARMAALEAASTGVNWTFAPMIDVTRDPRWGRIAESLGEDPYLHSVLGVSMIEGFQGEGLSGHGSIAACAKHFAGYGASESGRDYNTTNIAESELRNVYLPPFRAAVDAGVATIMTSFSDLNGVPASANVFLLRTVLRDEWGFGGFVVSDWASITQLSVHGLTANDRDAAQAALSAGVNMEMATSAYADNLAGLVAEGRVDVRLIDESVAAILRVKFDLGLFDDPYTDPSSFPAIANPGHLAIARRAALQSIVMLENRNGTLPLSTERLASLAVIGPLADDGYEQLGTWVFDGDPAISQTPLQAMRQFLGHSVAIEHVRAMETTRSRSTEGFEAAIAATASSDAAVVFLGEESILSGEAHSRANIDLPGNQAALVRALHETGKPVIVVVQAGRPLTLGNILEHADAILFAWHPGTMGGPAITDILFGVESPSGKLPVTFPKMVGQVPIFYAHKNTGKPATRESFRHIDDIPARMPQTSSGFVSSHLDAGFTPQYPFGFGLSYTEFAYSDIEVSLDESRAVPSIRIQATVSNTGNREAEEVVQLYTRDLVGSLTRPVRELKGFQRHRLRPGESRRVSFELAPGDLAFYGRDMRPVTEPGDFHVWVGGDSNAGLHGSLTLTRAHLKSGKKQ
jgi:beta-glucosidase